MPKVIITVEVEDPAKWEEGFRKRGDLFRRQSISKPVHYTMRDDNHAVACFEPDDLEFYLKELNSQETRDAMAAEGVKRETMQVAVLDREVAV